MLPLAEADVPSASALVPFAALRLPRAEAKPPWLLLPLPNAVASLPLATAFVPMAKALVPVACACWPMAKAAEPCALAFWPKAPALTPLVTWPAVEDGGTAPPTGTARTGSPGTSLRTSKPSRTSSALSRKSARNRDFRAWWKDRRCFAVTSSGLEEVRLNHCRPGRSGFKLVGR